MSKVKCRKKSKCPNVEASSFGFQSFFRHSAFDIRHSLFAVAVCGLCCGAHASAGALGGEIALRASQVGYRPDDPKIAVAFANGEFDGTFRAVEAPNQNSQESGGQEVWKGRASFLPDSAWGKSTRLAEIDFSALRRPGRYRLVAGQNSSLAFHIGEDVFRLLPDVLLEFMRQQRCGYNPWLDAECHQHDGRTAYGPAPPGTPIDVRGGWHDAADLLKYLLTSSNATAQMLLAWQLHQQAADPAVGLFADRVDAAGRPGANGSPDVLDEARWGIDWMLKLHPAPDQLYHQVADDRDHAGWRLPQNEAADYGWGKGGCRVVYFADGRPQGFASLTKANRLALRTLRAATPPPWRWPIKCGKTTPASARFAERCLQAGKEVYGSAGQGRGPTGNSYSAPYRYEETTWADDMEWGAAELFRATGDRRYLEEARRYAKLATDESWMGRKQTQHYQYYPFMNAGHFRLYDLVDSPFKKVLAGYYRAGDRALSAGGRTQPLPHRRAVYLVLEQPHRGAGDPMPALRTHDR